MPHPYDQWEGWRAGMYEPGVDAAGAVAARELLGTPEALREAMSKAIASWPMEAENWLSRPGAKSRSWLGAAGCMITVGATMATTRAGWKELPIDAQDAANAVADDVRERWLSGKGNRA